MAHLRYYRMERNRVDSVTLMLPDLNTMPGLMPSPEEYKAIEDQLKKQLENKLAAIDAEQYVPPERPAPTEVSKNNESFSVVSDNTTSAIVQPTPSEEDANTTLALSATTNEVESKLLKLLRI